MPHDDDLEITPLTTPDLAHRPPQRGSSRRVRALIMSTVLIALLATLAITTPLGHQMVAIVAHTSSPTPAGRTPSNWVISDIATEDQWSQLSARPLQLPHIVSGAPCPVSPVRSFSSAYGAGLGAGPIYPFPFDSGSRIVDFESPPPGQAESRSLTLLMWAVPATSSGPILVRGAQIDGNDTVLFNGGVAQAGNADSWHTARQLSALELVGYQDAVNPWIIYPSYVRLRAPGCYAFQIDAATSSNILIFRAE